MQTMRIEMRKQQIVVKQSNAVQKRFHGHFGEIISQMGPEQVGMEVSHLAIP